MANGLWLMAYGLWLMAYGLWLMAKSIFWFGKMTLWTLRKLRALCGWIGSWTKEKRQRTKI